MNATTNYQLNQWAKSDQVRMEDFNADNAKIDASIKAEADARAAGDASLQTAVNAKAAQTALTALEARVAALEEDRIYIGTYEGDGTVGQAAPLPWEPKVAFITGMVGREDNMLSLLFADKVLLVDSFILSEFAPIIQGASILVRHKDWYASKTMRIIAFR